MTFGQQPQGNNANGFNGQPYGQNQYNPNQNSYGQYSQNPYGQNQYQYAPQNMYAQGAPAATIPAQATYSYERAEHASVTRAYGEMTIGLLVTAALAPALKRSSRAPHASCSTCMPRSWASR